MADVTISNEALSNLHTEFAALAHKHASVSYVVLAVLALVLVLGGIGGWLGLRSFDAQLVRAQATEAKYEAEHKQLTDLLATDAAERARMSAQQATLEAQIAKRDTQAPPAPVVTALKPNATAEQLADGLGFVFKAVPMFGSPIPLPDGNVALTPQESQEVVSEKVDFDKLKLDFADTQAISQLETQKFNTSQSDLSSCESTLDSAQKTIKSYKTLAVRSKWQKFLSGAAKVGIFVTGVALGHKL